MTHIDFELPLLLMLLPLALLPLLPRARDTVAFSWTLLLPRDTVGSTVHLIWCTLAAFTIGFIIIGLAGPGQSQRQIERIGRGAELSILMDRSASMDSHVRRVALKAGEQARPNRSKNEVVRKALHWLVEERPENRYALTLFNVSAIHVAPFSDDAELVQAGLAASGMGRGPKKTNMGVALLSAIEQFSNRKYTGSRAILLVSDGGAKLDELTRRKIASGLKQHRISLYFIYIQSSDNSPDLERVGVDADVTVDEIALHLFFKQLDTDYRVFQANSRDSMADAVAQIDQQQNLPLTYFEQLPRIDFSQWMFSAAMICCLILSTIGYLKLERLQR